eukprot:COSAG02_NODE_31257_length_536_cov_1.439359_1_plen_55_part_10
MHRNEVGSRRVPRSAAMHRNEVGSRRVPRSATVHRNEKVADIHIGARARLHNYRQ